jgi:hypothetical protein
MKEGDFPNFKKINHDQAQETNTELKFVLNDIVRKTEVSGKFSDEIEDIKLISYQLKIIDVLMSKADNGVADPKITLVDIEEYLTDEMQTLNREYESYNTALSNFRSGMHLAIKNYKRRVALVKNQIEFCTNLKNNLLDLGSSKNDIESIKRILIDASSTTRDLASKHVNTTMTDQLEHSVNNIEVMSEKKFINNN